MVIPPAAGQVLSRSSDVNLAIISQSNGWAGAAAVAFMLWDTVVHFSDEVEYIWRGPNTWIRYMYVFIRYIPLLETCVTQITLAIVIAGSLSGAQFSEHLCKSWNISQIMTLEVTIVAVEIILVIRVYVLYNSSNAVLWILVAMFLAEIGVMITSVAMTVPELRFTPQCLSLTTPSIFMATWLSSLVFESVLFSLTLVQFFRVVHRDLTTGKHTFVYVFIRDGIWAFALIFAIFFITTLIYQLDAPMAGACFYWTFAIISFTGSHVLLNLRRLTSTSYDESQNSDHEMVFRHTVHSTILPPHAGPSSFSIAPDN